LHVDAVVSELEGIGLCHRDNLFCSFTGLEEGEMGEEVGEMGENVRRTDLKQEESLSEPSFFCSSYIYTM
jgi:hypothetical protein